MRQKDKHERFMVYVLIGLLSLSIPGRFQARSERQDDYPVPREVVLMTEEEAVQFRLTEATLMEAVQSQTKSLKSISGPRIVFREPGIIDGIVRTTTPLDLSVAFEPNLAPVDVQSLEVRARKGLFKKSLTSIVMPYVIPDGDGGWSFGIAGASIPHGNFRIEISISDQNGERTAQTYYFQVSRRF